MSKFQINVRPPSEGDLPWIYSSWINCVLNQRSLSDGCCRSCGAKVPKPDKGWAAAAQHSIVTRLLGCSVIRVACAPDDADQIFGYVVGDPQDRLLHWIYVKYPFRQLRVGTTLLESMFDPLVDIDYTFGTPALSHLTEKWGLRNFRGDLLNKVGRDVR